MYIRIEICSHCTWVSERINTDFPSPMCLVAVSPLYALSHSLQLWSVFLFYSSCVIVFDGRKVWNVGNSFFLCFASWSVTLSNYLFIWTINIGCVHYLPDPSIVVVLSNYITCFHYNWNILNNQFPNYDSSFIPVNYK
jgi:hypothetical protein